MSLVIVAVTLIQFWVRLNNYVIISAWFNRDREILFHIPVILLTCKEEQMEKALDGIRVIDFTRMYAGPFCTMILAELGADVVKVELPESGDAVRTLAPLTGNMESYYFVILNRGKQSVTLNLRMEEGQKICRELVKKCDVLVENFTPGIMESFGLGYEDLKADNPNLIYASLSGFGHTGPSRSQVAFDTIIQAMGGLLAVNGNPDSPPIKVAPAIADFTGGTYTALSIIAALNYRYRTHRGQFIDISMQDCVWLNTAVQFFPSYALTGREPEKLGNRQIEVTPFSVYRAKDGYIVIAIVTVDQWNRFLDVMERPDLRDVREYATQFDRIKHADEMDRIVGGWTRDKTVDELIKKLRAADLPCTPVPSFSEVAGDPHLAYRKMLVDIEQTVSGTVRVPGTVFKMSETPGDPSKPAPFLGEHNRKIYGDLLGYNDERINELQREGVL
jgi:CoA:oxalate CoA-transferase